MGRYYHTLLERERYGAPWVIEFGDYDRAVVRAERRDYHDAGRKLINLLIISTMDDQASIQRRVDELNVRATR